MIWIFLVLIYGILKGFREIAKKKAMEKNSVMEVLFSYTLISFIFVIPQAPKAFGMETKFYFFIALKSFFIFLAWIFSFHSLKKLPVSIYGILDLSRVLFATSLGVFILHEKLNLNQILGLIFVCSGLLLLKFKPPFLKKIFKYDDSVVLKNQNIDFSQKNIISTENNIQSKTKSISFYIFLALLSCFFNAGSGFLDKILMKDISSSQLQFWYMLFLTIYYLIYILLKKEKFRKTIFKNWWIYLLAIMFVISDKVLFIANGMEESKITIMTLIKQSGCIVTILGGRFIFKEKNTAYRLFCAATVILGIVIGVL